MEEGEEEVEVEVEVEEGDGGGRSRHKKEIKSRSRLAEGVWGYAHIRTGVLDVKVSRGSERRRDALLYPDGDGVTDAR